MFIKTISAAPILTMSDLLHFFITKNCSSTIITIRNVPIQQQQQQQFVRWFRSTSSSQQYLLLLRQQQQPLLHLKNRNRYRTSLSVIESTMMSPFHYNNNNNNNDFTNNNNITKRIVMQHNHQQIRTRMKLIDFDQFEPEAMAEKEARLTKEYDAEFANRRTYRIKKAEAKEKKLAEERVKYTFRYDIWEETIRNLLNEEIYPIGFTNTSESSTIASWCQQISHTLQQTLSLNAAMSLEVALKLLDRLFQEQEAHNPNSGTPQILMLTDISSSAIESALKSWKYSLLYPPYYEQMSENDVIRAQERVEYYGKFLAKHDDSMLAQLSKLLDVNRIVHTKTKTTDRTLWGHIPHTKHPNAIETNPKLYWGYVEAGSENEIDLDDDLDDDNDHGKMESSPDTDGVFDLDVDENKPNINVNGNTADDQAYFDLGKKKRSSLRKRERERFS